MEGGHNNGKRRQTQERGAGRKDERRRIAGGECDQRPGGRHFAPGEEVRSRFKQREEYDNKRLVMGGAVEWRK